MHTDLSFKISQLRVKNQNAMLVTIAVLIATLYVTALLPSLLIQYVYAGQQLFKQPLLLKYIPIVSFAIGITTFVVAAIGNTLRAKRIKFLEKQLDTENCTCCEDDAKTIAELESLAEALVEEKSVSQKRKSSSKKKSSKKKVTSKKKTNKK